MLSSVIFESLVQGGGIAKGGAVCLGGSRTTSEPFQAAGSKTEPFGSLEWLQWGVTPSKTDSPQPGMAAKSKHHTTASCE